MYYNKAKISDIHDIVILTKSKKGAAHTTFIVNTINHIILWMSGAGQSKHAILWAVIIPVEVSACILRDTRSKDGVEEDGAYLDIDLVEFHDEDFRDITTILKLGDTTKDKLTFTVSFWGDISFVILHLEMAYGAQVLVLRASHTLLHWLLILSPPLQRKLAACKIIKILFTLTHLSIWPPNPLMGRTCSVYAKILASRKFLPISPMRAIGENFFHDFFGTVKFLTHSRAHTYAHSNLRAPPTTSWKVTRVIGEIKFGKILSQYKVWAFGENFSRRKFYCIQYYPKCGTWVLAWDTYCS